MSRIASVPVLAFVIAALGVTDPAAAQPAPPSTAPATSPQTALPRRFGVDLSGLVGFSAGFVSGLSAGASLSVGVRMIQAQVFYMGARSVWFSLSNHGVECDTVGGALGARFGSQASGTHGHGDLMVSAGEHAYSHIGEQRSGSLFGSTTYAEGVSGRSPFIGVRLAGGWEWGTSVRLALGATAFFEVDLAPQQRTQTVYPFGYREGFFSEPPTPRTDTRTVTVGGSQAGLLLTLGLAVSR